MNEELPIIQQLRLINFKCFDDQTIRFGKLTFLSGLNGMGKSTVLQSLLLLRQSYEQEFLPNKGLALNGELIRLGTARDVLFEGATDEEHLGFEIELSDESYAGWRFDYERQTDVLSLISEPVDINLFHTKLFSDEFQYIEAERTGPRRSFEMSNYKVQEHHQLGSKGEYSPYFLSVFGEEKIANENVAHPQAASLKIKDQLEGWMQEIRSGTRIHFHEYPGMDLLSLNFSFFHENLVSSEFRSTNVGFGITYTLPVILALISAKEGSLILLENPEAHLHPRGQAKLGELIALASSGGVQVVVETHSDHVLNGIRVAAYENKISPKDIVLHFFENAAKDDEILIDIVSPQIDHNGRIDRWPTGFFDVWDDYLEKLLTPR